MSDKLTEKMEKDDRLVIQYCTSNNVCDRCQGGNGTIHIVASNRWICLCDNCGKSLSDMLNFIVRT
jgi:hypothetical protein